MTVIVQCQVLFTIVSVLTVCKDMFVEVKQWHTHIYTHICMPHTHTDTHTHTHTHTHTYSYFVHLGTFKQLLMMKE